MRLLLPLPVLLLTGCGLLAGHDGTYLLTTRLTSDSCNPESTQIGQESQALASIYRTGQSLVLEIDGALLVGTGTSNDFDVKYELGSETEYDGCDRLTTTESLRIEAEFQSDLGFSGDATSLSRSIAVECPDDEETSCQRKYEVTGMKLSATKDRRPTGSIAWGYSGGGGGY